MKKGIALLLICLLLGGAAAEEGFTYTNTSVTDCAMAKQVYRRFYESSELSVHIPGLAEGLIPQGLGYLPEENWLLFAGYRADKGNSALIAVSLETGEVVREVHLQYADGSKYSGHAGGVCVTEKNIYISNAHKLYRISLERFRSLPDVAECRFEEEIPVPVNASYCAYVEGVLWVGEFQYGTEYKTDNSHRLKTKDGYHRAWTCGYVLTQETENELRPEALPGGDVVPDYILSVTERIQGITVTEGKIYLSQSYGRRESSMIYRYEDVLSRPADAEAELNGQTVPVWKLDSTVQDGILVVPPMSECLCTVDGQVYLLFESGAQTYIGGAENPMDRVACLGEF